MPISILVSQGLIIVGALIYSFSYIWVNEKRKNLASTILKFKPSNPKSSTWIQFSNREKWIDKRESWSQIVSIVIFVTGLIWRYLTPWATFLAFSLIVLTFRLLKLYKQLKAAKRR